MRLYAIASEYKQILDQMDLCETEEERELLKVELDHLDCQGEAKILAFGGHIRNLETEATAIRAAVKEMESRARRIENQIERWKEYIRTNAETLNLQFPIKNEYYQISTRKAQPKLEKFDEEKLSFHYGKIKEEIVLDNEAIKADLLAGKEVEGAKLTYKTSIIIK